MVAVRGEVVGLLRALKVEVAALPAFPVLPPVMISQGALEDAVQVFPAPQAYGGLTVKEPVAVTGVLLLGTALVRAIIGGSAVN